MNTDQYSTLRVAVAERVAEVIFDNPPVNVMSATMMRELSHVMSALHDEGVARVVVFSSANPEFFLAHVDMRILDEEEVLRELTEEAALRGLNAFQVIGELLRNSPLVTIVKLAGLARGGGAEFVAAADMAFAARETTGIGQIESLLGIVPSGGGTQYLRERVGRHRALEVVLTGGLFDADTAAAYGWINRAMPAATLDAYVYRIADEIAHLPSGVAEATKRVLRPSDLSDGYVREEIEWSTLVAGSHALPLINAALANGAQTPQVEMDLETLMRSLHS